MTRTKAGTGIQRMTTKGKDGKTRRLFIAKVSINGKASTKQFDTLTAAKNYRAEVEKEKNGTGTARALPLVRVRFDTVLDAFLLKLTARVANNEIKFSTSSVYRSMIEKHLRPAFGSMQVCDVNPVTVTNWVDGALTKVPTTKTRRNVYACLQAVSRWAVLPGVNRLRVDPLLGVTPPKVVKSEARHLSDSEIAELLTATAGHPLVNAVAHVALNAGCRRGEIFAFAWDDLKVNDDGTGQLRVHCGIYHGRIGTPKTPNARRRITIDVATVKALTDYRATLTDVRDNDFMFTTSSGTMVDPDNFMKRSWLPTLKTTSLEGLGLHVLRHTHASVLLSEGTPVSVVSRRLGHGSISITVDTYGHLMEDDDTNAAAAIDRRMKAIASRRKLKLVG